MLFWFIGGALAIVWFVFHDARFDARLLAIGAIAPDVVDAPLGGARVAHSVVTATALLATVVVLTIGRRAARRRGLAFVIGVFLHLVLDGAFTNARIFWWPASGAALPAARLPSVERGWWNVALELVGLVLIVRFWRRFDHGPVTRARRDHQAGPA